MSLEATLKDFKRLIRVGLPLSAGICGNPLREGQTLEDAIRQVIAKLKLLRIEQAAPRLLLQFRALEAEFEYSFGLNEGALNRLEDYMDNHGLRRQLERYAAREDAFASESDAPLLRQKIWALMAAAFFGDYIRGDVDQARRALDALLRLTEELQILAAPHRPYGTRSRLHYFLGQCCRTNGDFAKAESHFLKAQQFADRRFRREFEHVQTYGEGVTSQPRIQYEFHFAVISTARVLGSMGVLSMLQGRLRRALQNLHGARTLLSASGLEPLKCLVDCHIAIAERRLAPPGGRPWFDAVRALEDWLRRFQQRGDRDGMRRCLQELIRAALERVEALPPDARRGALDEARIRIVNFSKLIVASSPYGAQGPEALRAEIYSAWWHMLEGSLSALDTASQHLNNARRMDEANPHRDNLELSGLDRFQVKLAEGAYRGLRGEAVSRFFASLAREARRSHDRVLEAEALLRAASAALAEKRERAAQLHLQTWRVVAPFIENAWLHMLSDDVQAGIAKPVIRFETWDLNENLHMVRETLCDLARARARTDAEAEELLNLREGQLKEWRRAKRLRPPIDPD